MKSVEIADARRRLTSLVHDVVEKGEEVQLTRSGRPVARLVPVFDRVAARAAMDWILSRHWRLDGLSIREMIDEGKRF